MPHDLHPSALKVLCYIGDYFNEQECAPSQAEIKAACGPWALVHLRELEMRGYLEHHPGRHRGLKILKPGLKLIQAQKVKP